MITDYSTLFWLTECQKQENLIGNISLGAEGKIDKTDTVVELFWLCKQGPKLKKCNNRIHLQLLEL